MPNILTILNIIVAVIIAGLILMQGGGAGLGSAWGGGGEFFQTKRGIEKWTMRATVLFICIFFILAILQLVL